MPMIDRVIRFARSPQGRQLFSRATDYARSPQGRARMEQARRQLAARRNGRPRSR
jgi:hypothetical protein